MEPGRHQRLFPAVTAAQRRRVELGRGKSDAPAASAKQVLRDSRAGIGVREAALAWFLSPIIGPAPAALLAVTSRLWISVGEAVLVAGGLLALRKRDGGMATGT